MVITDTESLLQSVERFLSEPQLLHGAAVVILGTGLGLLIRIVCKVALLYLASVAVLVILLQSCQIVHVQINPQQVHAVLWRLIDLARRLSFQEHALFAGGLLVGFKYGFFGWLRR